MISSIGLGQKSTVLDIVNNQVDHVVVIIINHLIELHDVGVVLVK